MSEEENEESPISERVQRYIDVCFRTHTLNGEQGQRVDALRQGTKELAILIAAFTPESREQHISLTRLEECLMFANAAIARNEK